MTWWSEKPEKRIPELARSLLGRQSAKMRVPQMMGKSGKKRHQSSTVVVAPGWSEDEAADGFWREVLHNSDVTDDTIARLITGLQRAGVNAATALRLQRGLDVLPPECIGETAPSTGKKVRTTNGAVCGGRI